MFLWLKFFVSFVAALGIVDLRRLIG